MVTVLPFGLSSAPYILTMLFRPLAKHCRSRDIHFVVYLDDGLEVESNEALSSTNSNIIKSGLASARFLANVNKCVWDPVQVFTWPGIVWDGFQGVISITETRLQTCLAHIDRVLSHPNLSARDLASLVGKIISMSAPLRNVRSIMTKHCHFSVAAARDGNTPSPLDKYCIVEL